MSRGEVPLTVEGPVSPPKNHDMLLIDNVEVQKQNERQLLAAGSGGHW